LAALQLNNTINRNDLDVATGLQLWYSVTKVAMPALHVAQQWSRSGSIAAATAVVCGVHVMIAANSLVPPEQGSFCRADARCQNWLCVCLSSS